MGGDSRPTFANGKICYLEIPALDIKQSALFYEKVFGWNIREDNFGNITFDDTAGEVSGMWVLDRDITKNSGVLISIMVYSAAETLKLIIENEGTIVKGPDENSSDVIALFADPAGNVFCLYQDQHSISH